jgi:hypothetical protein
MSKFEGKIPLSICLSAVFNYHTFTECKFLINQFGDEKNILIKMQQNLFPCKTFIKWLA